ncbi:MAG: isoleucine--tRNA ligase [Sphingomonadales bacterium]
MAEDYKSTLFLPRTDFAMKARLPEREPEMLKRWDGLDLYHRLRAQSQGREKFILHDGPPYANGHIHIGTALNKMLKDIVVRSQQMMGKDAAYVPGWDCHGLPIEWKIEEQYRKAGRNKDEVPVNEFRQECRDFAKGWIDVQKKEFRRLGVEGDWDDPYTTMAFPAEARIVEELLKFLMNGMLYKGSKAVMWSVVEKTALAEAEVEYHDHTSTTIDVAFPVRATPHVELEDAGFVIWTTTPWTMPGNRAIAYGEELEYILFEAESVGDQSLVEPGRRLVVAAELLDEFATRAGITEHKILAHYKGVDFEGTSCSHPWAGRGYDFGVPLIPGYHVTLEAGTGLVHTAPGHGAEDFEIGTAAGLEVPFTVDEGGMFHDHVPLVAGLHVYKAHSPVCELLKEAGALLSQGRLVHSYPHSWRSKAPLIFRNAPQWFISMENGGLRETALNAIDQVRWVPEGGRNRIRAMVESRPDWVISRQRAWGVPITVFVNRKTGETLRDEEVNRRIVEAVREQGADVWFSAEPKHFLGDDYDAGEWEAVTDILDVWFDSGSTHAFVLEDREGLGSPASLYCEGSDQHRGWFQSSLLESCGTRGRAPYDAVLTHGFVMDGDGRKMSKSLGNVVAPQKIIDQYGADILRLWVVASDYSDDLRIGQEIIKSQVDAYRKLRNTLRFLLGNLAGFDESERLAVAEMPELERWVLHRLAELDRLMREACANFDFHRMYSALYNFCIIDLSAFYFDIRKDALYCDAVTSLRRRAARTVLDQVFSCLTAWLAPILCFTAEEAWLTRFPDDDDSVHLRDFPEVPADWRDDALGEKWRKIRRLRRVVTGALELERRDKRIGSSLQAEPMIYVEDAADIAALDGVDLAEMAITSGARLSQGQAPNGAFRLEDVPGIGVVSGLAEGGKCQRCWRLMPEVGSSPETQEVCGRCAEAVSQHVEIQTQGEA